MALLSGETSAYVGVGSRLLIQHTVAGVEFVWMHDARQIARGLDTPVQVDGRKSGFHPLFLLLRI